MSANEFTPGDLGFVVIQLIGGPLDGQKYGDMPVMPDGLPAHTLSSPLSQPAADATFVNYERVDTEAIDGVWVYSFAGEVPPAAKNPDGVPAPADENSPSTRFAISQSWWIASELCRRHPDLYIRDFMTAGALYDILQVLDLADARKNKQLGGVVDMNRNGRIHLHDVRGYEPISWGDAISQNDPHSVVKRIERYRDWPAPRKAPATTPRALVYRVIAQILSARVNDRDAWDARSGFSVTDYGTEVRQSFIDEFPGLGSALRRLGSVELSGEPHSRVWFIVRQADSDSPLQSPVVAMLDDGRAFAKDGSVTELMTIYGQEKNVLAIASELLRGA